MATTAGRTHSPAGSEGVLTSSPALALDLFTAWLLPEGTAPSGAEDLPSVNPF